jgi:1,4-dihydroxy-2-naphthoate octaprenyltransferase
VTDLDVIVAIVLFGVALVAGVGAALAVDAEQASWVAVLTSISCGVLAVAILFAIENHHRPAACCACPAEAAATVPVKGP